MEGSWRGDIKVDATGLNADIFKVAFTYTDPRVTMKVANRLASVFIEESLSDRARLADGTSEFLETEIDSAKKKLTECDERLSKRGSRLLALECDAQADGLKLLLAKQQEANIRANLERRQIGEQFTLLDRARLPERPISPDRVRIAGIGVLAGMGFGLLLAIPSALRALKTLYPRSPSENQ